MAGRRAMAHHGEQRHAAAGFAGLLGQEVQDLQRFSGPTLAPLPRWLEFKQPPRQISAGVQGVHDAVTLTGPSGAGRTTAIRVLEDLGYEGIDNIPLSLVPRLIEGTPLGRPIALGLDVRNRDFNATADGSGTIYGLFVGSMIPAPVVIHESVIGGATSAVFVANPVPLVVDISNTRLIGNPKAKNVLIVTLEGIHGGYHPEIRQALDVTEDLHTMTELTAQTTNLPSNRAVWVMGIYHDRFERVKGRWRIASITFEFKYFTPFEEGWAKTPIWDTTS